MVNIGSLTSELITVITPKGSLIIITYKKNKKKNKNNNKKKNKNPNNKKEKQRLDESFKGTNNHLLASPLLLPTIDENYDDDEI